jgi:hypothetical protein
LITGSPTAVNIKTNDKKEEFEDTNEIIIIIYVLAHDKISIGK